MSAQKQSIVINLELVSGRRVAALRWIRVCVCVMHCFRGGAATHCIMETGLVVREKAAAQEEENDTDWGHLAAVKYMTRTVTNSWFEKRLGHRKQILLSQVEGAYSTLL